MAEFRIDVDRCIIAADEILDFSKKVNHFIEEIYEISCEPAIKIDTSQSYGAYGRLDTIAEEGYNEIYRITNLGSSLYEIVKKYKETEQLLLMYNRSINYIRRSGDDLLNDSKDKKDELISRFEEEHPEWAEKLDTFLASGENNKLTDDDIRDIKYLIYNANEPFRSIYFDSLGKYSIGNADMNAGANYDYSKRTVNYTYNSSFEWTYDLGKINIYGDSFGQDPTGKYTSFFHECGHAIDDLGDISNTGDIPPYDTLKFTARSEALGKDVTINEAIYYDVYNNPDNPHSMVSIANQVKKEGIPGTGSDGNVDNVLAAIRNGSTVGLSNEDLNLYNSVVNRHKYALGSEEIFYTESVSDIYGGVSKNTLIADYGYGHDVNDYWAKCPDNISVELWAEYYSYNMSGSKRNLDNLLKYFPETSKILEQYALSLAANIQ